MFRVSTVNLSADATLADSARGQEELGDFSAADLAALLDRFAQLDPAQNRAADPQLFIASSNERFLVRTAGGKLLLCQARATTEPLAELTSAEIVTQLQRLPAAP